MLIRFGFAFVAARFDGGFELGGLPVSVGWGYRMYVEAPAGGPDWGLRFSFALLFPP